MRHHVIVEEIMDQQVIQGFFCAVQAQTVMMGGEGRRGGGVRCQDRGVD